MCQDNDNDRKPSRLMLEAYLWINKQTIGDEVAIIDITIYDHYDRHNILS